MGSASPGLQLQWSIWEGVTWSSWLVWSWHWWLGLQQTGSASSAWWHSSVDTVSLQYKSHRQYLQLVWLQALVHCYLENISLWEGVVFLEAVFWLFHFGRVLRFWKAKCVILLVYLGTLAWDVTCSSSVMYPHLSGYCSSSQCQLYQLQCQFAIHSSLKGNRLPHLSPVLAESLFAWPCHGSWCTWPAMQLKTDELQLNLLGLPFLLQGSSHEVFWTVMADHLPVAVLSSPSGLLDDSSQNCWPFLWAFSRSGSVSQWSHYFMGSLVMMWCV